MARLSTMFSCCSDYAGERLIPNDDYPPRPSPTPQPQLHSKMPKRKPTTKQMAEAYIPSWQRNTSQPSDTPTIAPPATGRRSRGASASHGSRPTSDPSSRRSDDATGNMLYFGAGLSPEQAMKTYKSPTPGPPKSGSALAAGKSAGNASGRDASGYLSSSVGSTNAMNGAYSSLTYGGSLQYNFSGAQSCGAGTA